MTDQPAIYAALAAVMDDVKAVAKRDRNESQGAGFSFRGIDSVINAVGPMLRKHSVVVIPEVLSHEMGTVEVGQRRTPMSHVIVQVAYTFYAPDGSNLAANVLGEAFDSGDKAVSKAMSVAFRTALIQALALPTDEADPDESSYERSPAPEPVDPAVEAMNQAKAQVADVWRAKHDGQFDKDAFREAYEQYASAPLDDAGVDELRSFRLHLATDKPEEATTDDQPA